MPLRRFTSRPLLVAFAVAFVAACGTNATAPPAPAAPSAEDTVPPVPQSERMEPYAIDDGFTAWNEPNQGEKISFAAVLRNPNAATWAVERLLVTVTFTDAAGNVVYRSAREPVYTILPGSDSAIVGTTLSFDKPSGRATAMSVTIDSVEWLDTARITPGDVSFDGATARPGVPGPGGDSDVFVTCDARSTYRSAMRSGSVNVVFRDGTGTIIGGDAFNSLVNGDALQIPGQATTSLQFHEYFPPPQGVPSAECYYSYVTPR